MSAMDGLRNNANLIDYSLGSAIMSKSYVLVFKDVMQISFPVIMLVDFESVFFNNQLKKSVRRLLNQGHSIYVVAVESYTDLEKQLVENEELLAWIKEHTTAWLYCADNSGDAEHVEELIAFSEQLNSLYLTKTEVHYKI